MSADSKCCQRAASAQVLSLDYNRFYSKPRKHLFMKTLLRSISAAALFFCLTSCVKQNDLVAPPSKVTTTASSFATIEAADGFSWSTTNKIDFRFTGTAPTAYQLVLKVTLPDGAVILQKLQNSNEDLRATLEIPAHVSNVIVRYGSLQKTVDCKNGAVAITIAE